MDAAIAITVSLNGRPVKPTRGLRKTHNAAVDRKTVLTSISPGLILPSVFNSAFIISPEFSMAKLLAENSTCVSKSQVSGSMITTTGTPSIIQLANVISIS